MQQIAPTNKVSIVIDVSYDSQGNADKKAIPYEFIYGIGINGLTPLEKALCTKAIGEEVRISIDAKHWAELFGHLEPPYFKDLPSIQKLMLTAKIISITSPPHREVIQALSHLTSCGGGCGCGCH